MFLRLFLLLVNNLYLYLTSDKVILDVGREKKVTIRLVPSGLRYNKEILEMLEKMSKDENGPLRSYGAINKVTIIGFLQRLYNHAFGINMQEGDIQVLTFWVYDSKTLIGMAKLRMGLTPELEKQGGNLGYYIKPEYRNKGYVPLIVSELIEEGKKRGLKQILMTAKYDDFSMIELIMDNGGVEEEADGEMLRFWINLTETEKVVRDVE